MTGNPISIEVFQVIQIIVCRWFGFEVAGIFYLRIFQKISDRRSFSVNTSIGYLSYDHTADKSPGFPLPRSSLHYLTIFNENHSPI